MRVFDQPHRREVCALAFSPDGRYLAGAAPYRGVFVHDLAGGSGVGIRQARGNRWSAVVGFEPAGALTTITTDGRTRFDPATGSRLGDGPFDPDGPRPIRSFAASSAGTRLVTVQFWNARSRLICWDAAGVGWDRRWFVDDRPSHSRPVLSPTGDRVAFFAERLDNRYLYELLVLDAERGEPVGAGSCPYHPYQAPCYQPGGRQIVTHHLTALMVWDTRALGKPVLVRNDSRRHFTAAAFHPSGRYLFTTSNDATVTVWDADNWVRVKRFAWDIGPLRSVAVSADGLLAAAGSDRGRVVVWDVDV